MFEQTCGTLLQIGPRRIHTVRVRGGNKKYRALRLDVGNFSWGSECKCKVDVLYSRGGVSDLP